MKINLQSRGAKVAAGGAAATVVSAIVAGAINLAVEFIKPQEGRSLKPYQDIVGVWTYCDGETQGVELTKVYTDQECDAKTQKRVEQVATKVYAKLNPATPLTEARLMAYTSFSYNVGIDAFGRSTMLRLHNAGDVRGACREFDRWMLLSTPRGSLADKRDRKGGFSAPVDGKKDCFIPENKCMGIKTRRQAEQKACMEGL